MKASVQSTVRSRAVHLALCVASLALLATPARAQFMNRAIWLGFEDEGLRRDYRQDAEYFIDRASYVDAPPWWRADSLNPFSNRVSIAGGSVSSTELTLENSLQLGLDIGKGVTFRAQQLGSENQTTRYQRFAVGFDVATTNSSSFLFQLEGDADKARADVSFGAELMRTDHSAHRILFTLADWSERKSSVFEYDTKPYGLMLAGYHGDRDSVQFVYDLSTQLPFEERMVESGTVFEMQRTIGLAEVRVPIGPLDRIIFGLDGELTTKENRPTDPGALVREDADIARGRLRVDWWRSPADGYDTTLGLWLHHLDEDHVRPNDPAETRRVRRREAGLTGRMRVPLTDTWTLEPYLIGGHVDLVDRTGGVTDDLDFEGFQGKIGAPLLFRFSDAAFLRIDLSLQLDEAAFGGGGIQFQASF